jgi:GH25 family lysozyme M1 (1,4-beta-N-acetylmuramidase)
VLGVSASRVVVFAAVTGVCLAAGSVRAAADSPIPRGYGLPTGDTMPVPHLSARATAASTPAGAPGLDVSNHQRWIGWKRVAAAGYRFAWAKASEGTSFVDRYYVRNVAAGEAAGLRISAYDYARPHGATSAAAIRHGRAEARFFLSVAHPRLGQLRPALDVEVTDGLGPVRMAAWVEAWRATVKERTGYEPMIYASPYFWEQALADTTAPAQRGVRLWHAQWRAPAPTPPADDWAGRGWSAWQWTDCGAVPGIRGCVDMDVAGSPGGLAALVMGAPNDRSLPAVHGRLRPGHVAIASPGGWGGRGPLRFRIRWYRCAADGTACRYRAPGRHYRVIRADAGHTLRLLVSAANRYGQAWAKGPASAMVVR